MLCNVTLIASLLILLNYMDLFMLVYTYYLFIYLSFTQRYCQSDGISLKVGIISA
jgi:hypothetical protein